MKQIAIFVCLFLASFAQAKIQVAFFSCYDWQGELVEFEPGGRFCHVAIGYEGKWLHAHPARGVELKKALSQIQVGKLTAVLSDKQADDLTSDEVKPWLGIPYDSTFKWKTKKATYCSKLVGQLLEVPPKIMTFETEYWKNFKNLPVNELGISPDGVYRELIERGYRLKVE